MPLRPIATKIVSTLQAAGHLAFFAGGWVRDWIMQHPSDDIDIATSASIEEIQKLFPHTIPVGISFGILIVIQDNHPFEVATFRKDRFYLDGRRPVGFDVATPEEDAKRRDFTINGMFFDPLSERLYDYVGGKNDIEKRVIKAIGNPDERFREDRLRMMRAVRYATRFEFALDPATEQAILSHARDLLPAVAMERVWQEFKKMSQFSHFDQGLCELQRLGILPVIFPSLQNLTLEECKKRVAPIRNFPKNAPAIAEILELFPLINLSELEILCEHLKLSREEKGIAQDIHKAFALFHMPRNWQENLEDFEWAQWYAEKNSELLLQLYAARLSDRESWLESHLKRQTRLFPHIERLRKKRALVQAEDLLKLGMHPGPELGKLLQEASRISINLDLHTKEEVLKQLKPEL